MKKRKVKSGAQNCKKRRHEKTMESSKTCRPITSFLTEVCNNICQPEPIDATPTTSTSCSEFDSENAKQPSKVNQSALNKNKKNKKISRQAR